MSEQFDAWWCVTPILAKNKRTIAEEAWAAGRASLAEHYQGDINILKERLARLHLDYHNLDSIADSRLDEIYELEGRL